MAMLRCLWKINIAPSLPDGLVEDLEAKCPKCGGDMKGAEVTIRIPEVVRSFLGIRDIASGLFEEGDRILILVCQGCGYIEAYKRPKGQA